MAEHDRAAGPEWSMQINRYLTRSARLAGRDGAVTDAKR